MVVTYEVLIETDYIVEVFALLSASVIECQILVAVKAEQLL